MSRARSLAQYWIEALLNEQRQAARGLQNVGQCGAAPGGNQAQNQAAAGVKSGK
jgi:hypothetical protein